mgnify:CR=1 FL=1
MTISLKHAFTSAKGDGADTTLVRPSNWNAEHTLTCATGKMLGRQTSGTGAVEEISASTYMMGLLNTASLTALQVALGLPTTGDAVLTFKTTATSGWVLMNDGTIGDASSGASRANADTSALFILLYDNVLDANAPILTSAGGATTRAAQGSAATAYAAHCRMTLPKQLGRAIIVGGAGAGLTSRALGVTGGEETHLLTTAEIPSHTHTGTTAANGSNHFHNFSGTTSGQSNTHTHGYNDEVARNGTSGGGGAFLNMSHGGASAGTTGGASADHTHTYSGSTSTADSNHTHTFTTDAAGTGGAHNVMQPFTAWNVMIKL